MAKDIIIYPSGDTTNSNPFIRFSGGSDVNYIMEMTSDGYLDLSIEENIVTSGLTLYLDAGNYDSYSGGTTWYDLSGNNYDGTLVNGPVYNSGTFTFDNTDDYVNLPNDLGYSINSVSVFAWYKINGNPAGSYHIICGGQEFEMSIHVSHTYLRNGVYTSNGRFVSNNGNVSLNDGNYHYYGFTFDGSTKRAYIDGVQVGTQSVTGTLTTSFNNRRLGRFGSSSSYYANGDLATYVVWDKVLTATEVLQNYNAQKHRFGL